MQAATTSTSSSHHVSPISCPPQEKPQVTLADVLRGGAENDRRSLQAYLHTLAAREKEKRKRKRNDRKSKRSSSSSSSKRRKRSEEELNAAAGATSSSGSIDSTSSANSTPSGSIDMSANMMMRGSVDLSAMRLASNEYDMGAHHMRSRSVDFGALRSSTAAFDAMRASLDMSAMGPGLGLGQHYSHHGSFAGYQHHGSFHHPSARASCDFDATGFGADISPTSSFSMEAGPVFLEPAPLASFSVDEHSPQPQQQHLHQQQMMMNHGGATFQQPQPVQQHYAQQHHQQQMHMSYPQSQQAQVVTDLPDFEDFVSSAFLQAFPDQADPTLLEPGIPEQQPSPEAPVQAAAAAPVFAVPAPPQHFQQRQQSQHYHHPPAQQHHHQAQPSCSCPDCHVTPVHSSSTQQQHGNNSYAAAAAVDENSLGQAGFVGVEEDQVENFLAQFIEWSEQRGVASPSSASSPAVSSPASSLYY